MFDRVWHEGLFYKLKHNGIDGSFLCLPESLLTGKQQRVALDGHSSNWKIVRAGVPKGSILGPFLFLRYSNGLLQDLRIAVMFLLLLRHCFLLLIKLMSLQLNSGKI